MNLDDKKMQAIIEKLKREKFKYRGGLIRWERKTDLLYDSAQIYRYKHDSYIVFASRDFLAVEAWSFRAGTMFKESIDNFHCLYVDKNMSFEEIVKRYVKYFFLKS